MRPKTRHRLGDVDAKVSLKKGRLSRVSTSIVISLSEVQYSVCV